MRLYATSDGAWGVIREDEFAIIRVNDLPLSFFDDLDEAPDSIKLQVALEARALKDQKDGLSLARWPEVPATLSRLRFLLDSPEGPTKGQLEEIYTDLRDGLGF
jgi:hypothetical protein